MPTAVGPEPLGIAAGEPHGHPLPQVPVNPCGLGFVRQRPLPINLMRYRLGEAADRRTLICEAQDARDLGLPAEFDPKDFAGNGVGSFRDDAAANENLGAAKIRLIATSRAGGYDDATIPIELRKSDTRIAQPAQRVERDKAACLPADDDVPKFPVGFRSR
jgi:hypothetical protein